MTSSTHLFDLQYIDTMAGGDAGMRDTLLELLCEELPREQVVLHEAIRSGSVEAVFQASHSLKSTLAYTGNEQAITLNSRLESATRNGQWAEEEQAMAMELVHRINELVDALPALVRRQA